MKKLLSDLTESKIKKRNKIHPENEENSLSLIKMANAPEEITEDSTSKSANSKKKFFNFISPASDSISDCDWDCAKENSETNDSEISEFDLHLIKEEPKLSKTELEELEKENNLKRINSKEKIEMLSLSLPELKSFHMKKKM